MAEPGEVPFLLVIPANAGTHLDLLQRNQEQNGPRRSPGRRKPRL